VTRIGQQVRWKNKLDWARRHISACKVRALITVRGTWCLATSFARNHWLCKEPTPSLARIFSLTESQTTHVHKSITCHLPWTPGSQFINTTRKQLTVGLYGQYDYSIRNCLDKPIPSQYLTIGVQSELIPHQSLPIHVDLKGMLDFQTTHWAFWWKQFLRPPKKTKFFLSIFLPFLLSNSTRVHPVLHPTLIRTPKTHPQGSQTTKPALEIPNSPILPLESVLHFQKEPLPTSKIVTGQRPTVPRNKNDQIDGGGEETGAETLRRIPSTEDDGARAALASRRSKPDEAPRES